MDAPIEVSQGLTLLTQQTYYYHVETVLDLEEIRSYFGLSKDAFFVDQSMQPVISITIKFCEVNGDFCTPFVHVQNLEDHDQNHDGHEDEEDHDGHVRTFLRRELAEDDDEDHDEEEDLDNEEHTGHAHDNTIIYLTQEQAMYHEEDMSEDPEHMHGDESNHEEEEEEITTILQGPTVIIELDPNQTSWKLAFDIPVTIDVAGLYLPLGAMQFFLSNATIHDHEPGVDEIAAIKIDVAAALHQRQLLFRDPPDIQEVSKAVAILSYVIIAIVSIGLLVLELFIIKHRKEKVMLLSQGSFLSLFQAAAILATTCTFLFEPKSDAYCYLSGPLVLVPLQFMLAILFGRLRRIVAVMAPIMGWQGNVQKKESSDCSKLGKTKETLGRINVTWKSKLSNSVRERKQLRREFSACRLWIYAIIFTLPLIILLVIHYVLNPPKLTLALNEEETIGKYQCGDDASQWFQFGEMLVIYVMFFILLFQSQRSRSLPALFNEAESVAQASMGTIFIATAGLMILAFANGPTANPDIRYIMLVRFNRKNKYIVLQSCSNLTHCFCISTGLGNGRSGDQPVRSIGVAKAHANLEGRKNSRESNSSRPQTVACYG
jgi:hypothetical protein